MAFPAALFLAGLITFTGCNATSGHVMNQTGMAYYKRGNYTMARDEFRRAVADNPHNANYRHNLAAALHKQGDFVSAEQTYRQALNVNPSHQPSYHGLASLLKQQNRQPEAMQLVQTWSETQPYTAAPNIEMAWLQRESGDVAGAERSLQQALRTQPNHPVALAHLGQHYQDTGQNDRAAAMYQRSLHNNWYQPKVQSRLASIRERPIRGNTAPRFASQPYASPGVAQFGPPQRVVYQYPPSLYASAPPAHIAGSMPAVVAHQSFSAMNADPAHTSAVTTGAPAVTPF
jgi:Tfp pilus assembly protein PilF